MKREILFRGFCPNENGKQIITLDGEDIRGDWVFGDLIHNIDCVKVRERETDINRIAKSYEVIPETVGQFTGLTDNPKELGEFRVIRERSYYAIPYDVSSYQKISRYEPITRPPQSYMCCEPPKDLEV